MNRRDFLKGLAALPVVAVAPAVAAEAAPQVFEWEGVQVVTAVAESPPSTAFLAAYQKEFIDQFVRKQTLLKDMVDGDYFKSAPELRVGDRITFAKRRRRA
jgi:hypothetical protein